MKSGIVTKGSKRTQGLPSIELAQMVVEEIAKSCPVSAHLFALGVLTSLRGSDLRPLQWADIEAALSRGDSHLLIRQKKTSGLVQIDLNDEVKALFMAIRAESDPEAVYVFEMNSRRSKGKPISRSKSHNEIAYAAEKLKARGILPEGFVLSIHSSRKTLPTIAFQDNHSIATIATMLGHSNTEHTLKYLSIGEGEVTELREGYKFAFK